MQAIKSDKGSEVCTFILFGVILTKIVQSALNRRASNFQVDYDLLFAKSLLNSEYYNCNYTRSDHQVRSVPTLVVQRRNKTLVVAVLREVAVATCLV